MEMLGVALVAAVVLGAAVLVSRLRAPDAAAHAIDLLTREFGELREEIGRVAHVQAELRLDVQRGREASLRELAAAARDIQGELGQAHRALAEVRALEQGRARQMDQAASSLRRLEAVVAGSSTRGAAGENILARALGQLPPDLLVVNAAFGNKIVEYALRLPGGRLLPIDSKWTSVACLEQLEESPPAERRRLVEQVVRDVRSRIREMAKYLDPERTLSLGIVAVPDAVYETAPEAHVEGYLAGVLVVPYSLALPFVLALYRLTVRFGCTVDADRLVDGLRTLDECFGRMEDEVESRLSRGLVQVQNARDALRDQVSEARRSSRRLLEAAEREQPPSSVPIRVPVV